MINQARILAVMIALALSATMPVIGSAHRGVGPQVEDHGITPENIVIVSNQLDARFSRDFSVLLKHLRLEWVILTSGFLPESVTEKNLLIIGHPDAEFTGDLIRQLLSDDEIEEVLVAANEQVVLEIESPWKDGRTVFICSGNDLLLARNAAEDAIRTIIASNPTTTDWIRTTYEIDQDEDTRDFVERLQYQWYDTELPAQDLAIDVNANYQSRVTTREASEDVERLFSILSHGYSGYALFNQQGQFAHARNSILEELTSRDSWSRDAFSELLHDHLSFIVDCHMRIGEFQFCQHSDFWFDVELDLLPGRDGYQFTVDDSLYTLMSIDGADPHSYLFPSLNQQGEPIYRIGMLSAERPPTLPLTAMGEEGERRFEIELQRSDFDYYSESIFREDVLGGIPVVRIRSFTDSAPDELGQFVATAARYHEEPVVIVDLRGNDGGNEHWPISWIQRLTGRRAESVLIRSELESITSMRGRANAFEYWDHLTPGSSSFQSEADRFASMADAIEARIRQPRWTTPVYPIFSLIPNDTTIIVVTNNLVASAGEGMVMRISRLENVVIVGENSMGALAFGNVSTHMLPNSGIMIWISINFNIFPDHQTREGVGLLPDLWVPADEAVNYAVAAVRRGTITTSQPLMPAILSQEFIPENPDTRAQQELVRTLVVAAIFAMGGFGWAFFMRQKSGLVTSSGAFWAGLGGVLTALGRQPVGAGLMIAGIICLIWGGINQLKVRRSVEQPL